MALAGASIFSGLLLCGFMSLSELGSKMEAKESASLADHYFAAGDYKQSISHLKKALSKDPNETDYLTSLGWSYFKLGDYDQAIAAFTKAAEIDPDLLEGHTGRGWSEFKKLNFDAAIAHFNDAVALNTGSPDPYDGLGWTHAKKGNTDAAEGYFNTAIHKALSYNKAVPAKTDPEAHRGLGYIYFNKGEFKKALPHFVIATQLSPDWNDARTKWGDCLFELKKYKEAVPIYRYASRHAKTVELDEKIKLAELGGSPAPSEVPNK